MATAGAVFNFDQKCPGGTIAIMMASQEIPSAENVSPEDDDNEFLV
jgi:hypothetical protein